jgi:hypothetical protein
MHNTYEPISRSWSASSHTSNAPSTTTYFFIAPLCQTSSCALALIGSVVPILTGLLRAMRCFWVTTMSPGPRCARTSSLVWALMQSAAPWLTAWQWRAGFINWLLSCTAPSRSPLWSTVTTSAPSTSSPIPFSTSTPSMLRLIFTFVRKRVAVEDVRVLHVSTIFQFIDILTKALPSSIFSKFRSNLNICSH